MARRAIWSPVAQLVGKASLLEQITEPGPTRKIITDLCGSGFAAGQAEDAVCSAMRTPGASCVLVVRHLHNMSTQDELGMCTTQKSIVNSHTRSYMVVVDSAYMYLGMSTIIVRHAVVWADIDSHNRPVVHPFQQGLGGVPRARVGVFGQYGRQEGVDGLGTRVGHLVCVHPLEKHKE